MKKLLFGMVLALLLVSLVAPLTAVADDGDNFEKAGQQALQEREEVLIKEEARLEQIVQVLAADRVVIKDEMLALRNEVERFNDLKERYDKELELYGLKTSTALNEGYKKAIDAYIVRHFLFKRDDGQETVRAFFATETGQDVVVERGAVIDGFNIFIMLIAAVLLLVTIVCLRVDEKGKKHPGWAAVFSIFFVTILLVLFLA